MLIEMEKTMTNNGVEELRVSRELIIATKYRENMAIQRQPLVNQAAICLSFRRTINVINIWNSYLKSGNESIRKFVDNAPY